MEVNHMTNYISRRGKLFQSNYYAKVGARAKTNTKWKKGDGRRGFLSSSPPPPSFLFFALVLEMAMAIRFLFPFLLFRCSFLCVGITLWKGVGHYNQTCIFNGHSWRMAN